MKPFGLERGVGLDEGGIRVERAGEAMAQGMNVNSDKVVGLKAIKPPF